MVSPGSTTSPSGSTPAGSTPAGSTPAGSTLAGHRLAFAGSGTITVLHGLAAQLLGIPVTAVASRNPDHAQRRAEQLDATAVAYEELPAGAGLVIVATTPERHAGDALRCLDAGAAVLIEKPLCSTLGDADRLVAAANRSTVSYAENLLHAPATILALDQIAELCADGPLVNVEATAVQGPPEWGSFLDPERGGGVLFDLGAHAIALVLAATPSLPVGVRGRLDASPGCSVDDDATIEIDFADGLTARIATSWRSDEPRWDLQVAADHGVVRLEVLPNFSLERDGNEIELTPPSYTEVPQLEQLGYAAQLESALADAVAERQPIIGAAFGRAVLDVICGAYLSAHRDGRTETLPFTGPRHLTPHELWTDGPIP